MCIGYDCFKYSDSFSSEEEYFEELERENMSLNKPNWNNTYDRQRYEKMQEKIRNKNNLNEKQKNFFNMMYHIEEFNAGLL